MHAGVGAEVSAALGADGVLDGNSVARTGTKAGEAGAWAFWTLGNGLWPYRRFSRYGLVHGWFWYPGVMTSLGWFAEPGAVEWFGVPVVGPVVEPDPGC